MKSFSYLCKYVEDLVSLEEASKVLEIGDGNENYGLLVKSQQHKLKIENSSIDRIYVSERNNAEISQTYDKVFSFESIEELQEIDNYDVIIIHDFFEYIDQIKALDILRILTRKITKQVFIITPKYAANSKCNYYPTLFIEFDFSFTTHDLEIGPWQIYNFFPKQKLPTLEIDNILESKTTISKMNISFILPNTFITGGMKALYGQMKALSEKGHNVTAYAIADKQSDVIPEWCCIYGKVKGVPIQSNEKYPEEIWSSDLIVVGWLTMIIPFLNKPIPVVLWEQGSPSLFGDNEIPLYSASINRVVKQAIYRSKIYLLTVSSTTQKILKDLYNRSSLYQPPGIDIPLYNQINKNNNEIIILLIGRPDLSFKGFKHALKVLEKAFEKGAQFKVKWVTQIKVDNQDFSFPMEVIVSPSQEDLAKIYKEGDILLSTSVYEAFSLPPLEAMATGVAVIATDSGGIRQYAKNKVNCILCEQEDIIGMSNALLELIQNKNLRSNLIKEGFKTVKQFSLEETSKIFEKNLWNILSHYNENK